MPESLKAPVFLGLDRAWLIRISKIVAAIALIVIVPFIFGMKPERFEPLFKLTSLRFIGIGVAATIVVSLVSIILSLPLATFLALGRISEQRVIKIVSTVMIEALRALPLLLLMMYINLKIVPSFLERFQPENTTTFFGAFLKEIFSTGGVTVAIALTIYTAAVNAELLRSGILSLDRGQDEAAKSLGMTYWQRMYHIILPQAYRRTLAPLVAQFTTLVKDTSLGVAVSFTEIVRRAQIMYQENYNPMEALYMVAIIYFIINYALGQISLMIERRGPSVHLSPDAAA